MDAFGVRALQFAAVRRHFAAVHDGYCVWIYGVLVLSVQIGNTTYKSALNVNANSFYNILAYSLPTIYRWSKITQRFRHIHNTMSL